MTKLRYFLILSVVLISACDTTKRLAPGQKLYTGADIKITDKNVTGRDLLILKKDLQALPRPNPNGKILGIRLKLYFYQTAKTNRKFGIKHFLFKNFSEPPVLISAVDIDKNASIIQNRLQNQGYFLADVEADTIAKPKTVEVVYTVKTGPAYHYRKIIFPNDNEDLDTAVAGTAKETLLKPGDKFNLDVIKSERVRIDARLKEEGFFYFSPENLIMRYDSTVAGHQIDMWVKVKAETPDQARWVYSVRNIYVYPGYTLRDTSVKLDSAVRYQWYNIIDPKKTFKPYTFENCVLLRPGDIYNRTLHTNSLSRFVALGPFKFVKNRFEDVTPDSAKLDIYYFLTQQKRKALQFEIQFQQSSANYNGTRIDISAKNRNTFGGAELFTTTLFVSRDIQFGSYNNGFNVYQFGIQPSIVWPRFLRPFIFTTNNAFIPHTILTTGYTLAIREKLYTLNSYNAGYGYQWKPSLHVQQQFNLMEITFANPANVTQLYLDSIKKTGNPALAHVINRQFTFGPTYEYTWTNTMEVARTNTFYYDGKISLSANLIGLISGADTLHGKVGTLFGIPYNQYVKLENEIRFFHKLGLKSSLATRLLVGVGVPYGNSTVMPYTQQFFIGGTNSLRGFQAHAIGPGTYKIPQEDTQGTNFIPDQSGDIKIEANVEYRPHLFSIFEGAVFLEAGNIWLVKSHESVPGGTFGKNFITQMAVDAGAGIRLNLTVLLLRLDLGVPLINPNLPPGQRVVPWNTKNAIFNLAIGYPF